MMDRPSNSPLNTEEKRQLIGLIRDFDIATNCKRQECLIKMRPLLGDKYLAFLRRIESVEIAWLVEWPTLRLGTVALVDLGILTFADFLDFFTADQVDADNG